MSQSGSKIILYRDDHLIAMKRDNLPYIKFPNFWDLPGGGIEGDETPRDALLREVKEELGITLCLNSIVWERTYTNAQGHSSFFFAAPIKNEQIRRIKLGDEGQQWQTMHFRQFCTREDAVPHFRPRVATFFASSAYAASLADPDNS